jgi:hypothetical protein
MGMKAVVVLAVLGSLCSVAMADEDQSVKYISWCQGTKVVSSSAETRGEVYVRYNCADEQLACVQKQEKGNDDQVIVYASCEK